MFFLFPLAICLVSLSVFICLYSEFVCSVGLLLVFLLSSDQVFNMSAGYLCMSVICVVFLFVCLTVCCTFFLSGLCFCYSIFCFFFLSLLFVWSVICFFLCVCLFDCLLFVFCISVSGVLSGLVICLSAVLFCSCLSVLFFCLVSFFYLSFSWVVSCLVCETFCFFVKYQLRRAEIIIQHCSRNRVEQSWKQAVAGRMCFWHWDSFIEQKRKVILCSPSSLPGKPVSWDMYCTTSQIPKVRTFSFIMYSHSVTLSCLCCRGSNLWLQICRRSLTDINKLHAFG